MKPTLIFAIIAGLVGSLLASAPLSTQSEIDKAFSGSQIILSAKIISKVEVWTLGGEIITEAEAREIEKGLLAFQQRFMDRFGIAADETTETKKFVEEWLKTGIGKKSKLPISCLILATVSPTESVKGAHKIDGKVIHASWTSGILQTCSDVNTTTEVNSQVLLFLKNQNFTRKNVLEVGHSKDLLIGSFALKPTKTEQDSAHQSTTAP